MIDIINADILTTDRGLVVHGTNCSGGFGSGIAGQIRKRFPIVYEQFKMLKPSPTLLGQLQVVHIDGDFYIGNLFSQIDFGNDGKRYASVDGIYKGLNTAFKWCLLYNLPLHSPKIGCGLGGLDWHDDVQPIYIELINKYPSVNLKVYEYIK